MKKTFLILAWALVAISCSNNLTNSNLSKVADGMKLSEVTEILGSPNSMNEERLGSATVVSAKYKKDDREVILVFVNDSLTSKSGNFLE